MDVDTIRDDWLTDNVHLSIPSHHGLITFFRLIVTQAIAFWEEYLEREELSKFPKARIILLRPSMSFMILNTPDPSVIKDALPDLKSATHIFLPVNDNQNVTVAEGGTHWSLLLVSVIDGTAFHYDSLGMPGNDKEARTTTERLEKLIEKPLQYYSMQDAPLQENGSDCGVFVCLLTKHLLLKRLLIADANTRISMKMADNVVKASEGRKEMLRIIEERRKEAEKRRS
jgi:sentrin-specific protease 8